MPRTLRVFIALDLPQATVSTLADAQDELRARAIRMRWVPPRNMHLTLAFIGEIERPVLDGVFSAVDRAVFDFSPFRLAVAGMGVFPNLSRPRVLWAGFRGDTVLLLGVKAELDRHLGTVEGLSFHPDNRPFRPHLTLGRAKGRLDSGSLKAALRDYSNFRAEEFITNAIHVYQSRLGPRGAVYTRLHTTRLLAEVENQPED